MLTINYNRELDSDFQGLASSLISLFKESFPISKEIYLVKFDDGATLKVTGEEVVVKRATVEERYISSGFAGIYGTDDSKFGKINYQRVLYVAHTHPAVVTEESQSRPSGKDTNDGVTGDYEVSKTDIPVPHYVISGKYIYCIDYTKDEQTVSGLSNISQLVSFFGKWSWGESFSDVIESSKIIYVSDQHFDYDNAPELGTGETSTEQQYDLEEFSKIKGEMIIDESGNIILQTNE